MEDAIKCPNCDEYSLFQVPDSDRHWVCRDCDYHEAR